MQHDELDRDRRPQDDRLVHEDERTRNRSTEIDTDLQRDGNLGNERNRNTPDRDRSDDSDFRMSER